MAGRLTDLPPTLLSAVARALLAASASRAGGSGSGSGSGCTPTPAEARGLSTPDSSILVTAWYLRQQSV